MKHLLRIAFDDGAGRTIPRGLHRRRDRPLTNFDSGCIPAELVISFAT